MLMPPPPTPKEIQALSEQVTSASSPLLAGQHPVAQGAALADLVATWLASHACTSGVAGTRKLRQQLLSDFIIAVETLVPVCAEELGTPHDPMRPIADNDEPELFRRQ